MRRSILNRFISAAADHLALSLLWLAGCLPLVTAPAATAALFEVTRLRHRGEDPALVRAFLAALRQQLAPALAIGLGATALGAFLAVDLKIALQMGGPGGQALAVAVLALLIMYAVISTALFPVLASFDARPSDQLRTAALVALLSPGRGALALAAVAAAGFAVWLLPLAVILVPSLAATAVLRLYRGAFERLRPPETEPLPLAMSASLNRDS